MDTSQEYIKTCEKAKEIQDLWIPTGGDWYLHNYHNTTGFSEDIEKQVWGTDDSKWKRVEILCYQPSDTKEFYVCSNGKQSHVMSTKDLLKQKNIWLPRQDQLQKFVWDESASDIMNLCNLCRDISDMSIGFDCRSMEMLWLEFVMSKLYLKTWNGEDWEIIYKKEEMK